MAPCSPKASPRRSPPILVSAPFIWAKVNAGRAIMAELLAVKGLSAGYGRAVVLSDISFRLGEGEALAVLGRNGVGKTTLIDSHVGGSRRFAGSIALGVREVATLAPETRA